ncbi:glycoside hydrolase family 31 protein [Baudoinia panamericana UAMH 10762]|uniref:alpha-glucosidase n=1 Tax=Baudoinia panamericana (strain UAMH 10762) TaxID=717646 RepID=M2MHV5_BAUPA|nr:glycoside hydrolase family 31 protein [Baudoinia panamericana UAMH 10762]EMC96216.1 glycoside hydrolase family 31 protein [Baudoinia panamericana UAMH 10762]
MALSAVVAGQQPQYPPAFPPTPILPSSINYAPSVMPTVMDLTAPNAQSICPGYTASNVQNGSSGLTADLTLAGPACNAYGNDVRDLTLSVQYQSKERLSVKIFPKYLVPGNQSLYILSPTLTPQPALELGASKANSDLAFTWTNSPSFQFQVSRVSTGDVIFSTYGSKIVFEDQFLELVTSMVPNYNIYGLAENLRGFRIPNNFTQTFWNAYNLENDQELDVNGHSVHPVYLETRYGNSSNSESLSHGVYARNAHGQEWLMRNTSITYRTIGGSFDLYFLSGSTPKEVISQYQTGVVNTPYLPAYWHLGFHQVRWSYQNWSNLQDVVDAYAAQNIQLEGIMNDLDYLKMNRDFTNNPGHYDVAPGKVFLDQLHANGQYYMPILDPNIYVPNPANASDAYPTYDAGAAVNAYIRNGNDSFYIGVEWPGFSVFPDFIVPQTQQFWTQQILAYHQNVSFDGFWLDVNDAVSFCTGSCGQGLVGENPIHVPFALPGDPNTSVAVDYRYPEFFNVTNATEAASASSALMSQSLMYPTPSATPTPTVGRTVPTPGVRNLTFPPYAINNFLAGHSLLKQVIAPNATHNDGPYNSTEYELHNLYGHTSGNATYNALKQVYPGKRPFFINRSTFAGSGNFTGHWGGDTNSMWGNMYFGISQALQFSIAGIPYFGVETCGFNGNADMELCTRWMQLSAWYPMYRNHNSRNTIAQEAYRWATTAEATRRIMNIRYSLLPYTYTLFHQANVAGQTVLRALPWEFPNDPSLKAVETQFMSGPALLVTPVLAPLATSVQGVFPGVANGTIWYDWYTLEKVNVSAGENKTLDAPLEHQPIHVRGGYIIPMQKAGNTTKTSRQMPWSLLVALDSSGKASGELYLDDGISLMPNATKNVELAFANNVLNITVSGNYNDNLPLANVTIAGVSSCPHNVSTGSTGSSGRAGWSGWSWPSSWRSSPSSWWSAPSHGQTGVVTCNSTSKVVYITNLQQATSNGIWTSNSMLVVQ